MKRFHLLPIILFTASCASRQPTDQPDHNTKSETVKNGNVSVTLSTDTARLGEVFDPGRYQPDSVRFRYRFTDNSGGPVPGPSDSYLEAVLYYSAQRFDSLRRAYYNVDYPDQGFRPDEFAFDWLDSATIRELYASDTTYTGHPNVFYSFRGTVKLWLLNGKVFVKAGSN